jgi:uncharacterized ubiquitin-like protein YukD
MKLRLFPIIISVIVTSVVLFGGWFVYHSVAMENPLKAKIEKMDGVQHVDMQINGGTISVDLRLSDQASVRKIVQAIESSNIGDRELNIHINNDSSPTLDQLWSNALFDIAQSMETKQYAEIPATLNRLAENQKGLQVSAEMDNKNVYIRLTEGEFSKFVILPRNPAKLGVWPNE